MFRHIALVLAVLAISCSRQSNLPKLFPVPNATLISEANRPVQLDAMKGHVTIYDFIFTNCAGTCPMMTATMRRITSKIDKDAPVRFVSISVDPRRDTPAVLRSYASRVRNDRRWVFLTGNRDTIVKLSVDGFKLAVGGTPATAAEPLLHSSKFAVADKEGVIRAYYSATDEDAVKQVTGAVKDLLAEE